MSPVKVEFQAGVSSITSFDSGDLTAGILTVVHNLGSTNILIQVYDDSGNQITPDEITLTDSNTATIDLSSWGTISGTWKVVIK